MPKRSSTKQSSKRPDRSNGKPKERKVIRLPYVKKLAQRGPISVWEVDGSYVRTNKDQEFNNYGHHYTFKYIPKDEFWIDQGVSPEEIKLYINRLLYEHREIQRGKTYDEVRDTADRFEGKQRKHDLRKMTRDGKAIPQPTKMHRRLWKKLTNRVSVWIVNGRLVRSVFDDEFTQGGHDHVYEYIPENEIWIDDTMTVAERPYALLHEMHERNLMSKGANYDKAHAAASRLEKQCRRRPNELHTKLANEGWE